MLCCYNTLNYIQSSSQFQKTIVFLSPHAPKMLGKGISQCAEQWYYSAKQRTVWAHLYQAPDKYQRHEVEMKWHAVGPDSPLAVLTSSS